MKSIRAHLVLWLVAALTAGAALVVLLTYTYAHEELDRVFDDELRQIAEAVHLREDWKDTGTVRVARPDFLYAVRAYDATGRLFFETMVTARPFDAPRSLEAGYSEVESLGELWRVYTHVAPEGIVQVAQPMAARQALARELSLRMLLPILLLIPMLGAVLAWVSRRGLAPLEQTSRRVQERDAGRLDPLPTQDVPTELRPLVDALNALLARLAASMDAQQAFLADAAHELRSPVAALALQAQLAERAQNPQTRAAAFADLKEGIARAGRMVEQLLNLERLQRGGRVEPPGPVDIARLARDVVGAFAARADTLGLDLGVEAPPSVVVSGAEAELRSLIANLVDNALRYAPRGSEVTVSLRARGDCVELEVLDAGPGIPADHRSRVFERFQRIPGDVTPGSGVGLHIVSKIVERHSGSIALEDAHPDAPLPGLLVRVSLPCAAAPT
ncbi:MAG TPA: ATP-binding protein [Burkholderiales bacterium]|nr:ATP-binding protein [Burkholderiales bacterium]